ncbi:MAG TPA: ABC transporter permease [Polyangia bacterium]|nr:ABC transporter permease [Polyangia bacterium]
MTGLSHDLRVAARGIRAQPALSVAIFLTLALGIGVNASVFSVVEASLLRPLPYPAAGELLTIWETREGGEFPQMEASYPNFLDWRARSHGFAELAGFHARGYAWSGHGTSELVPSGEVTGNFFRALGVAPALGRAISADDERPDAPHVVVLDHAFWRSHFGGRPDVLGQTITLEGQPHVIVGVLPAGFAFAPVGQAELWTPLEMIPDMRTRRNLHWLHVLGRLRAGVTLKQARAELAGITVQLTQEFPASNTGAGILLSPLADEIVGPVRPILLALLAGVALVLLIAAANIASLMLARSLARQRELAIREALGASRLRMFRQLVTESLLYGIAGGLLGLLVAMWGADALVALVPEPMLFTMPYLRTVRPDLAVLGYTLLLSLLVGVVAGLAPALQIRPHTLGSTLADEGRGSVGRPRRRMRAALVASEVCLAFALLTSAGLVTRSLWRVRAVDPGFDPHGLLAVQMYLPDPKYPDVPSAIAVHRRILDALSALPGVAGAASVSVLPLGNGGNTVRFVVPGRPLPPSGLQHEANIRSVSAGYFDLMRVPFLSGRRFKAADDAGHPRVAIVNRTFAARIFPGEDPVGKAFRFTYAPDLPLTPIIGVVGDEKLAGLDAPTNPAIYMSYDQDPSGWLGVVVRSRMEPGALAAAVTKAVAAIDPDLPVVDAMPMEERMARAPWMFLRRFPALLATAFALAALALAAVGLNGVIAHSITQRTHEIGIRRAVGARARDIVLLVLRDASRMVAAGLLFGLAIALGCGRALGSLLWGVRTTDPTTLAVSAAVVILVALAGTALPLLRALRIDPMEALR